MIKPIRIPQNTNIHIYSNYCNRSFFFKTFIYHYKFLRFVSQFKVGQN